MKRFLTFLFICKSVASYAGSCCLGSGPRSFVQLRHLQSYEVGVSSSFRDVSGRFTPYGTVIDTQKNQSYNLSFGGSFRITPRTEGYAILPFVSQVKGLGGKTYQSTDLGDALAGIKVHLLEPLFEDDWYPDIKIVASIKMPTGTVDSYAANGNLKPGTGNGIWEPSVGMTVTKDLSFVILGFNTAYTRRFARTITNPTNGSDMSVKEGDRIEMTESAVFPLFTRFSAGIGSTQYWDMDGNINGTSNPESGGRLTTGFLTASYFVSRFWNVAFGFESSIPISRFGVNQDTYRAFTLTTTYAIY